MVLEFKLPAGHNLIDLQPTMPLFLAYVLSFLYLGIYWNNHHHLFHITDHVDGRILWANLHLLFWLSLIPFGTAWMAEEHFSMIPVALYGVVLLLAAIAYYVLVRAITAHDDANHRLREAIGSDRKGEVSLFLYILALLSCFIHQWIALGLYAFVALLWLVPSRKIERAVHHG